MPTRPTQFVWYYNNIRGRPEKKKIISRWHGYHGSGLITGCLTGLELFHTKFDLPFAQVLHTEAPYHFRRPDPAMDEAAFTAHCAAALEDLIEREGADTIAAFIGEPVLGTRGIVPPPAGYWDAIQEILARHDILLIADEVVTGFGGSAHVRLRPLRHPSRHHHHRQGPDLRLRPALQLDRLRARLEGARAGHRRERHDRPRLDLSAHPIGAAAAIANLRLVDSLGLMANAGATSAYLNAALKDGLGGNPNVGDVRGEGMPRPSVRRGPQGLPLLRPVAQSRPGRRRRAALPRVIARAMPQGDILGFAPPLCLTRAEADTIVAATAGAVAEVLG